MTQGRERFDIMKLCRHRWHEVIGELTRVKSTTFNGKPQPCPLCGGKDRFRYMNRNGDGTYICRVCGSGSGWDLLAKLLSVDHATAAARVKEAFGDKAPLEPPATRRPKRSEGADRRKEMYDFWESNCAPVTPGDPMGVYLASRCVGEETLPAMPTALRYSATCPLSFTGGRKVTDAMIAKVVGPTDKGVSLHRTFLTAGGEKRADLWTDRALWHGDVPDGAACRLFDVDEGGVIGIAEGIETALSAFCLFNVPVWAALNANFMEKWRPPAEASTVYIFADNDRSFTGEAAAYGLAHKIACDQRTKHMDVRVRVPLTKGTDWADEWATLHREEGLQPAWKTGARMV